MLRTLTILFTLLVAACNPIYKANVQQGNMLEQDMINELRPGMTKRQVELVLGTPSVSSTFHGNRWDYVYTFRQGRGELEERHLTVFFENDRLVRMEGDWKPDAADVVDEDGNEQPAEPEASS